VDQGFGLASEAGCKTLFSFSKADLAKRFLDLADAPDELVPGINYDELPCSKGKKASKRCRERNGEDENGNKPSKSEAPTKSTVTSSQLSTTSASATPVARKDCAAIGRRDQRVLRQEYPDEIHEETVGDEVIGGRELLPRGYAPKKGTACKRLAATDLHSKNYPSASEPAVVSTYTEVPRMRQKKLM
jgi:hypothetical protein